MILRIVWVVFKFKLSKIWNKIYIASIGCEWILMHWKWKHFFPKIQFHTLVDFWKWFWIFIDLGGWIFLFISWLQCKMKPKNFERNDLPKISFIFKVWWFVPNPKQLYSFQVRKEVCIIINPKRLIKTVPKVYHIRMFPVCT